jgi:hypothetical protein
MIAATVTLTLTLFRLYYMDTGVKEQNFISVYKL